jgi:hypothetical protein
MDMDDFVPMEAVGLVPHKTVIIVAGEIKRVIEPSGNVARVSTTTEHVGFTDGILVSRNVPGEITGLPERKEGTILIVSSMVAAAAAKKYPERRDIYAPDTNRSVRDADGNIIGVSGLQVFWKY